MIGRNLVLSVVVGFSSWCWVAGCGPGGTSPAAGPSAQQVPAAGAVVLQALDAGGLGALRAREPERAAAARRHAARALLRGPAEDFEIRSAYTDVYGFTSTRLRLTYDGIPVWHGEVVARTDAADKHLAPFGRLELRAELLDSLDLEPGLSPAEAIALVTRDLAPARPKDELQAKVFIVPRRERRLRPGAVQKPRLNALDVEDDIVGYALAYRITAHVRSAACGIHSFVYLIDAHTGETLSREDAVDGLFRRTLPGGQQVANPGDASRADPGPNGHSQYSGDVSIPSTVTDGHYELFDSTRGGAHSYLSDHYLGIEDGNRVMNMQGEDPRTYLYLAHNFTGDDDWGNGQNFSLDDLGGDPGAEGVGAETAGVDVMYGITVTWDMLQKVFGRSGLDGAGFPLVANVHSFPAEPDIAYWDPEKRMPYFFDRVTTQVQPTSPDVVGHEFGHGLLQFALNAGEPLGGSGEFGGVKEANSDILGTLVEFYASSYPAGAGGSIPASGGNWLLGEQVLLPPLSPRYLYKPSEDGGGYDAWSAALDDPDLDNHNLAGPINRMFYFLSEGALPVLVDPDRSSTYMPDGFTGVGIDAAARIWYRAVTSYLVAGDKFVQLRQACLQAAADLYGAYSDPYKAVMDAFAAVNVGEPADRVGPRITITQQRSADTLAIQVELEDDSPIESIGYSMSGQNAEGQTLAFGSVAYEVGPEITYLFNMSQVFGYTFRFTATATDAAGNSTSKTIIVDLWPPHIFMFGPHGGLKNKTAQMTAFDDRGFSKAELYVDGELYGSQDAPFQIPEMEYYDPGIGDGSQVQAQADVEQEFDIAYDMSSWSTGIYELTYVVYDSSGNSDQAVTHEYVDNTPPVLALSVSGSSSSIQLRAAVTESCPSEFVDNNFFVDGVFICATTGYNTSCTLDSRTLTNGDHLLRVDSVDGWDNLASASVTFSVHNGPEPPDPPDGGDVSLNESEPNDQCNSPDLVSEDVTEIFGGISFSGDSSDNFHVTLAPGESLQVTLSHPGDLTCYSLSTYEQDQYNPSQWHYADESSAYPLENNVTNVSNYPRSYCVRVWLPSMGCPDYTLHLDR